MTAPQEAGGTAGEPGAPTWLDMSRYPDTDPDTVLSADEHDLLSSSLAVDDGALPDAVWEHMLAVVTGDTSADDGQAADDGGETTGAADDDPLAADDGEHTWPVDLEHGLDHELGLDTDPGAHDLTGGHDDHGLGDAGWDGGPP